MHQVQLSEQLYDRARRRAAESGFSSVDDYVANVLNDELALTDEALDALFDADRLARLDQISQRVKSGEKTYTMDEVADHFEKKRKEWLQNRAG